MDPSDQQLKKNGFATKLLQTMNLPGKRGPTSPTTKSSNFNQLNEENQVSRSISSRIAAETTRWQMLLMRAVDAVQYRDSEHVVTVLDESRDILRDSLEEFKREQNECRRQLETILKKKKPSAVQNAKNNVIPLSIYLQQKRAMAKDDTPLSSEPTSLYLESLVATPKGTGQPHPSDRAAVIKYLRKRERRKRAEENRKTFEMTDDALERVRSTKFSHRRTFFVV